ncbi:MAG: alkaline phosphatase family protein [Chitinophagaceae bacterium]
MKIVNRLGFILLLLAANMLQAQQTYSIRCNSVTELQQFLSWSNKRYPLISAHRGGPEKGFPENALETFKNSTRFQPIIIECDITLTKDSALVLMHDDRLNRTSTGNGPVSDYTYEQLRELKLKDNDGNVTDFKIPLLDEVLQWGKGKVIFTLDVKRNVPYARVIEAVRKAGAEACSVIITYNANQATEVHQLAPDLMISASIQNAADLERLHNNGVPDNRLVAFVGVREASDSLYTLLHSRNIQCIVGTMGNLDRQAASKNEQPYYDYISRGADILSSDRPREAGAMLQRYIADNKLFSQSIRSPRTENRTEADTTMKVVAGRINSKEAQKKPYVILISLDGFRYDYAEKHNATHLQQFGKQGVHASSMIPSYPSLTFPNHYTLATGMYPAHHGLIGNSFYDPASQSSYSMGDKVKVADNYWYGGTPLWVLAEQHQMLSASFFWVGSETDVKGIRPTYYYNFSNAIDPGKRIEVVKNWLSLPEETRPHLITFYLSEPDHTSHTYGPDAAETHKAVQEVDSILNELTKAVATTGLPVNYIVVSDHGMTAVDREHPLATPAVVSNQQKFIIPFSGTTLGVHAKNKEDIQPTYEQLKKEAKGYTVYLKENMPAYLHYGAKDDSANRLPDIMLLPVWPQVFSARTPGIGHHGFDPVAVKDMHAIFYAWGPAFKKNMTIPSFENVHVYPLVAGMLGLQYKEKIDGKKEVLNKILK